MSIQFRPRIGPFVRVPNRGPGLFTRFISMLIVVGIVWPLQAVWFLCKWTAIALWVAGLWLVVLVKRQINHEQRSEEYDDEYDLQ